MSTAKYPSITVDLKEKIRNGFYQKKLPVTRELATEYGVSKQTITNALRPLVETGLLKSEGYRGISIHRTHKQRDLLCVVVNSDIGQLKIDPDFLRLQKRIDEDGFDLFLISTIGKDISCHNVCKLLRDNFTGIIFMPNALTFEIAEYLEKKNTPFVFVNRLPVYSHVNWVEYNWVEMLSEISQSFTEAGYIQQALFFQGRPENYNILIKRNWKKIKHKLGIPELAIDNIRQERQDDIHENFADYLKSLNKLNDYPQVLIIWHGVTLEMSDMLCNGSDRLPDSTIVVGLASPEQNFPEQVRTFSLKKSNYELILQAYQALHEKILTSSKNPIHRIIPNQIIWNQSMPFGYCSKEKQTAGEQKNEN